MKKRVIVMIMIFSTLLVGCSNYSDSADNSSLYDDSLEETIEETIEDNRADRMTIQEYRETYLSEVDDVNMTNEDGYVSVYFDDILGKSECSENEGFFLSDGNDDDGKISNIKLNAGSEEYFSIQGYYLDGMIEYINLLMNDEQDYSFIKDEITSNIDSAYEYRQDMLFDFSTDSIHDDVVIMENDKFILTQSLNLTRYYNSSSIATAQIHIGNKITLEHK